MKKFLILILALGIFSCKNSTTEVKTTQTSKGEIQNHSTKVKIEDFSGVFKSEDNHFAQVIPSTNGANIQFILGTEIYQRPIFETKLKDNKLKFSNDSQKVVFEHIDNGVFKAFIDDNPEFTPLQITFKKVEDNSDYYFVNKFEKDFDQYFVETQYFNHSSGAINPNIIATEEPEKKELIFDHYHGKNGKLMTREEMMVEWHKDGNEEQNYYLQFVGDKIIRIYHN